MVGTNGKDGVRDDVVIEADRPGIYRISFEDMQRATKVPDATAFMVMAPEEMGLDYEEMGLPKGSTIAAVYRPFKPGENADIRETVKDFPEEQWLQEYYDEIILRCIIEPPIPNTAEGRKVLQRWQPGSRQTLAVAIQNQSGLGAHTIKSAKDELAKLLRLTPNTSST